jgi:Transglutaminase-like superfamily
MENVERWAGHTPMSDPAGHVGIVTELPSDVEALNSIIQGLLIHSDWLTAYGLDNADYRTVSRSTLPVADRLDCILANNAQNLEIPRSPGKRSVGTCRDFALMLCSFLRSKGVPARVRCGFADYFSSPWEDHWVCEYWDGQARKWLLSDAQMDGLLAQKCRIGFDPTDVPRRAFMTAGEAWSACRDGKLDPNHFGHGEVTGTWFMKVNVLRDHYVLNGRETSAWDGWRAASSSNRVIGEHEVALLDDLAARPEQQLVEAAPDWLG